MQKAFDAIRRALSLTEPQGWGENSQSNSGENVSETDTLGLSTVWGCVNLLAGTIGSLPFMTYRSGKSGGREIAGDHWAYRLLHDSPNAEQTAVDFWTYMCTALELRGNAYARKDRIGNRVVALTPINPADMRVGRNNSGELRYRWVENGLSYETTQDDILHIRGFCGAPLGGLSTLSYGLHMFGLAKAINKAAGSTFKNGMRPSGVFAFKNFLKDDQRKIIENGLQEKYIGAINSGRPLVLEGGTEWQQITLNPEDAQMLQSRSFSVEEICRWFGVPPHMVGHTEKNTSFGAGLEQQVLAFQKFTLRQRLKRIEQSIQKQLLTPQDRAQGILCKFNLEGLLRGDSAARSNFYASGLGSGWFTINEVRAYEDLPPVEGGDVPRMQAQYVPITQVGIAPNVTGGKV